MIVGKMTFEFPIRADASLLVAFLIAGCSRPNSTAGSSALKADRARLNEGQGGGDSKSLEMPWWVPLTSHANKKLTRIMLY